MGFVKLSLENVDGKGFTLMCSLTDRGQNFADQMEGYIDEEELELFLQKAEKDLDELCSAPTSVEK